MNNTAEQTHQYAIHSDNLSTQVHATLDLLNDLSTVLNQETHYLRNGEQEKIFDLKDQKIRLGQLYYEAMMGLKERNEELRTEISEPLKQMLNEAYIKIHDTFDDNLAAIDQAQKSAQRVQKIIFDAARASVADGPNYNQSAYTGPSDKQAIVFTTDETA